jgi:choline-sulfatase
MIVAGPDIPKGKVSSTNVNLVDCFPGIVEAVGARFAESDRDLPGESIFRLAQEQDRERTTFSEYHAIMSPSAAYMLRRGRWKYIRYVGMPPQLFDIERDRNELRDLGQDAAYASVREQCEAELRRICDPEATDRRAKTNQQHRVEQHGGREAVLAAGVKIPYTPAPEAFDPAPVEARERARAQRR